jgi:hypothetical protein
MTLAVEQKDYCYGDDMALLIVQSITVDQRLLPSMEWVVLHCVRLRHDGAVLGPCSPLIRTSALAAAIRPTGWLPPVDSHSHPAAAASGPTLNRAPAWPMAPEQDGRRPDEEHRNG